MAHAARGRFLLALGLLAGCQTGRLSQSGDGGAAAALPDLVRELAGPDVRMVRIWDVEARRYALGVERGAAVESEPGTDGTPALLLLTLDAGERRARWPIGERRALDAAVGGTLDRIAYVGADGRPCAAGFGRAEVCGETVAEPVGLDLAADGRVVFAAHGNGGLNLWLLERDGGERPLTAGPGLRDRPLLDPDDRRVAFVAGSAGGIASLFLHEIASGETRQLTNVGLALGPPGSASRLPAAAVPPPLDRAGMRWDGGRLVYASARDTWRVDPETGAVTREVLP